MHDNLANSLQTMENFKIAEPVARLDNNYPLHFIGFRNENYISLDHMMKRDMSQVQVCS